MSLLSVHLLSLPMQTGETFKWKSARGYLLIIAILVAMILLTIYLSQLQIQKISQEIPTIGGVISLLPFLLQNLRVITSKI